MTFPILPLRPQVQGMTPDVESVVLLDTDQSSFGMYFDLEATEALQPVEAVLEEEVDLETAQDAKESIVQDGEIKAPETDETQVEAVLHKPLQTLAETAFSPVITTVARPNPSDNSALPLPPQNVAALQLNNIPEKQTGTLIANASGLLQSTHVMGPRLDAKAPLKTEEKGPALRPVPSPTAEQPTLAARNTEPRADEAIRPSSTQTQSQQLPTAVIQPPGIVAFAQTQLALQVMDEKSMTGDRLTEVPFVQGVSESPISASRIALQEPAHVPTQAQYIAKSAAHQMAIAVSQTGDGTTEIQLSPDELGRVRMVMSAQESGMAVLIYAERPETNDLLKRYIETLAQEFKNMGYDSTSFTFAQEKEGESGKDSAPNIASVTFQDDGSDTPQPIGPALSAGLDLRL